MVPRWVGESRVRRAADLQEQGGGPPKDLGAASAWRRSVMQENLDLLEFYGTYLSTQIEWTTGVLRLSEIREALELDRVPQDDRHQMTLRLLSVHRILVDYVRASEES